MRINSTLLKQFIMISPFSDSIICNHKNLIRIADRRKPVCDRDRGPVLRKLFQALLDPALTLIVKRTGRLIQNQYRRVLKKYSCNRNPLLLSTRQTGSSFSYKADTGKSEKPDRTGTAGCLSVLWIDQGKYCLWKTGGIDGRNYRCGEEGKYP